MRILDYNEKVVWEDPVVVMVEEVLDHDDGIESSTYTIYMAGARVVTATTKWAAEQAVRDIIKTFEDLYDEDDYE